MRLSRLIALAGVAFALCAGATPAFAWEPTKTSNGVVIMRGAEDTATAILTVSVYYDYKGGSVWSSTYDPTTSASYNSSRVFTLSGSSSIRALEVPLEPGYRCQNVRISQTGAVVPFANFPVLYEPLNVAVRESVPVTVSSMPSMTLDGTASVSVDSTLAVNPWETITDSHKAAVLFLVAVFAASAGYLSVAFYRLFPRVDRWLKDA